MKRTLLDKFIGTFSPLAELNRIRARAQVETIKRLYDAADSFATDDWSSATLGSANSEIRTAQQTLRAKGRDSIRNNAYANRALSAIVSNTVGAGILPNIQGKSDLQTRRIKQAWKEWADTNLCDANGRSNFYALQAMVLRSTVESGEIVVLKEKNADAFQLRLLESDYIVTERDTGGLIGKSDNIVQGIKVDKYQSPVSYYIYDKHPGDDSTSVQQREIAAERLCHVFRQDRPGQLRGVSWFHPVLRTLEDLNQFEQATLISKKVQACFSVFIESNNPDSTLSSADLLRKRQYENRVEPASIRYLDNGEKATMVAPAATPDYDPYTRNQLRKVSSGMGIPYEAMTGDYSLVNFSSGRLGREEFKRNVETWRWQMVIPQFCEPAFEHFLEWAQIRHGIDVTGVTCDWVPPAWSMIDPTKEIAAMNDGVRSGLITYKKAVLELGYDPETHLEEIKEFNEKVDELGITLDSDPRKTTKAGLFQVIQSQNNSDGDKNNVTQDSQTDPSSGSTTVTD
jgi:lambda family phage portal protein